MRNFFKLLKYLVLIILSVVVLLFSVAEFAEDHIASISVKKINQSIGLPISYDEISFSLLREFPLATLEINNIWMGSHSQDLSTNKIDTLANIGKVYVSVRMLPLISEQQFDIVEIEVEDAVGFYSVDSAGISNIDFLLDSTQTDAVDTTAAGLQISLKELAVENMFIHYSDQTKDAKGTLAFPEVNLKGKFKNGIFESAIEGKAILADCSFGRTNLGLMKQTTLNFEMEYLKDSVFISEAHIESDGMKLLAKGKMGLNQRLFANLQITSPGLDLNELKKYIPSEVLKNNGIENISGIAKVEGTINGILSDSIVPGLSFNFELDKGAFKLKDYPVLSNIQFKGQFTNGSLHNNQSSAISINQAHFESGKSYAKMSLDLQNLDNPHYRGSLSTFLDLHELKNYFVSDSILTKLKGKMEARLFTEGVLPEKIDSTFLDYLAKNSRGVFSFRDVNLALPSGLFVDSCNTDIEYFPDTLRIKNTKMQVPQYHFVLTDGDANCSFSGLFSEFRDMTVEIDSLHLRTPKSLVGGKARISNLKNPFYEARANLNLDMQEMAEMLPDTLIKSMKGKIEANLSSSGKIRPDSIIEQIEPLIFKNSTFNLRANNFSLEMPDTLMNVEDLTGEFSITNDSLNMLRVSGKYANIKFSADSAMVTNSYGAIFQKNSSPVTMSGKFALGDIDYSDLAQFLEKDSINNDNQSNKPLSKSSKEPESTSFSYHLKGTLSINSFKYKKSTFENLSCRFNISDSLGIIEQFKTDAFNGTLNNAFRYELYPNNRSVIAFKSKIDKMDISTLLEEFDDFDQNEISHNQLSGLFSTKMNGRLVWHGDSLIMDSIQVKGDLKLEDGGLFNYKRAMELADFTSLDELDNIHFKTMESQLFIFKNALYVPKTDIRSNAMDITAYGMQTFGEDYQYHLRIYLGEILHGKTKRIRKKQEEMADNPDEKGSKLKSLYVQSSSINGKSKNGLDNKKDRFRMQTKINVQEKILNIIFHPMLVDFDTGVEMSILRTNQNLASH